MYGFKSTTTLMYSAENPHPKALTIDKVRHLHHPDAEVILWVDGCFDMMVRILFDTFVRGYRID